MKNIAYFITSHGYGHAARACAVMNELSRSGKFSFVIFSKIPLWFFSESLLVSFTYQDYDTDIGLVQKDPFNEDLPATLKALRNRFPVSKEEIIYLSNLFSQLKIDLVICDISPVGLIASKQSSIPSILIENFTWDWIYEPYQESYPEIKKYSDYLKPVFDSATYHFQTDPICLRNPDYPLLEPIFREPKKDRQEIRDLLGVQYNEHLILVTMGGIPYDQSEFSQINESGGAKIVIPGSQVEQEIHFNNFIFLPQHHQYFHPDLIAASDIVIGKVGYSTIAEVYSANIPFLYLTRSSFRESQYLVEFIKSRMIGKELGQNFFKSKDWISKTEDLMKTQRKNYLINNGTKKIADFIEKI